MTDVAKQSNLASTLSHYLCEMMSRNAQKQMVAMLVAKTRIELSCIRKICSSIVRTKMMAGTPIITTL